MENPVSLSRAAELIGVFPNTLRKWEKQGFGGFEILMLNTMDAAGYALQSTRMIGTKTRFIFIRKKKLD